jgi:hypothetical protein
MQNETGIADSIATLRRAGWNCTIMGFGSLSKPLVWIVDGRNGKSRLRAEGKTKAEAWESALVQACGLGMTRRAESEATQGQG